MQDDPRDARLALKSMLYFEKLNEAELEQLAAAVVLRQFSAGQVIFHMGDPGGLLYIVKSGKVKIYFPSIEGEETMLDIFGEGAVFGEFALFDNSPRSATAEAIEETEAYTLHRTEFLRVIRSNTDVAIQVMAGLAEMIRRMNTEINDVFNMPLPARVARKLLNLAENHGKVTMTGIVIPIKMTQTDLAKMTGATRVSINKVINRFKGEGWISVDGGVYTLKDSDALELLIRMSGG